MNHGTFNTEKSYIPKIITDPDRNCPNAHMRVTLSVEQYYDLLHHTHNAADIVGGAAAVPALTRASTSDPVLQNLIARIEYLERQLSANNTIYANPIVTPITTE